jgi:hypothetical protein
VTVGGPVHALCTKTGSFLDDQCPSARGCQRAAPAQYVQVRMALYLWRSTSTELGQPDQYSSTFLLGVNKCWKIGVLAGELVIQPGEGDERRDIYFARDGCFIPGTGQD